MLKFTKILTLAACVACSIATARAQDKPPEEVNFQRGPAPARHHGYATYMSGAGLDAKGVTRASAILTLTKRLDPGRQQSFSYEIDGLRRGDIVPAMGELYRVDSIGPGRDPSMTWRLLDREKWPEKVATNSAGIAVFLKSETLDCSTSVPGLEGRPLSLVRIEGDMEKKESLRGTLHLRRFARGGYRTTEATVKVGDYLLVDGKGHEVLSVVPANPKTRVVGWVELHFAGIPEADLKPDKKAYVTPTPVKK